MFGGYLLYPQESCVQVAGLAQAVSVDNTQCHHMHHFGEKAPHQGNDERHHKKGKGKREDTQVFFIPVDDRCQP